MKEFFKKTVATFLSVYVVTVSYGQNGLELGINIGTYIYQGDLTPSAMGSYKTPGFGAMAFVGKRINNAFSVRANLAYAKIKGDDAAYDYPVYRQQRNFNFSSRVIELSGLLVWEPFSQTGHAGAGSRFSPFLSGGAGVSILNIKRDWSNFNALYFAEEVNVQRGLAADSAHALPRVLPVIPLGIGVKYALSQKLSLLAESSYRFTVSDYVDGFSKAANASKKDSYSSISVGLVYKFGKNMLDCPVVPK